MAVTIDLIKELRAKTEAGFADCKKALEESDCDIEKAIDWLRKSGIAKSVKKEGRVAAEGLAKIIAEGNTALLVEVNSETDFAAKNAHFVELVDNTAAAIMANKPSDENAALDVKVGDRTVKELFTDATAIINEKLTLRRFEFVTKNDDEAFGVYTHSNKQIVAVAVVKPANAEIGKYMAMQIASMAPTYVSDKDMPAELVEHEREIQKSIMDQDPANANKPEAIKAKMLEGKVSKALKEMCLVDQEYILDQSQKVGAFLKSNNVEVVKFARFKVGEGIEKKKEDYAAEVAAVKF